MPVQTVEVNFGTGSGSGAPGPTLDQKRNFARNLERIPPHALEDIVAFLRNVCPDAVSTTTGSGSANSMEITFDNISSDFVWIVMARIDDCAKQFGERLSTSTAPLSSPFGHGNPRNSTDGMMADNNDGTDYMDDDMKMAMALSLGESQTPAPPPQQQRYPPQSRMSQNDETNTHRSDSMEHTKPSALATPTNANENQKASKQSNNKKKKKKKKKNSKMATKPSPPPDSLPISNGINGNGGNSNSNSNNNNDDDEMDETMKMVLAMSLAESTPISNGINGNGGSNSNSNNNNDDDDEMDEEMKMVLAMSLAESKPPPQEFTAVAQNESKPPAKPPPPPAFSFSDLKPPVREVTGETAVTAAMTVEDVDTDDDDDMPPHPLDVEERVEIMFPGFVEDESDHDVPPLDSDDEDDDAKPSPVEFFPFPFPLTSSDHDEEDKDDDDSDLPSLQSDQIEISADNDDDVPSDVPSLESEELPSSDDEDSNADMPPMETDESSSSDDDDNEYRPPYVSNNNVDEDASLALAMRLQQEEHRGNQNYGYQSDDEDDVEFFGGKLDGPISDEERLCWKILPTLTQKLIVTFLLDPNRVHEEIRTHWIHPERLSLLSDRHTAMMVSGACFTMATQRLKNNDSCNAGIMLRMGGLVAEFYQEDFQVVMARISRVEPHSALEELALPIFHEGGRAASNSAQAMEAFIDKYMPADFLDYLKRRMNLRQGGTDQSDDEPIEGDYQPSDNYLTIIDTNTEKRFPMRRLHKSVTLATILTQYADDRRCSLRTLRFSYNGKQLFMSSSEVRKQPASLIVNYGDEIHVTKIVAKTSTKTGAKKDKAAVPTRKIRKVPREKKKKIEGDPTKAAPELPSGPTMEERKINHSNLLTLIFEEADPKFRSIRQRLNNMGLERSKKKTKIKRIKPTIHVPVANPPTEGLGGKAGKTEFIVLVGEIENLYKSSKKRTNRASMKHIIDLHGCTRDEAWEWLESSLPQWVETAMLGHHPWLIGIKIICGGGNQILSELVDDWIKRKDHVANAPKNYFTRK